MAGNMKVNRHSIVLFLNSKVYSLEVIYSTAYIFLDNAYVLLDEGEENDIRVTLKPKEGQSPEKLGNDFLNELIVQADFRIRVKDTKKIREAILKRALLLAEPEDEDKEIPELIDEVNTVKSDWQSKHKA